MFKMKKLLYVVLVIAIVFLSLYIENLNDTKELKVVGVTTVWNGDYEMQIAFENGEGYYAVKTEDGNLWKTVENIEVNDIIMLNTLDTKDVSDDVIVDIIKHK